MAGVGHNKPPLKSFTARIEALEEERDNLGADIKEVYVEVKAAGYSPKVLRKVIAIRKRRRKDEAGYDAEQASISDYAASLGDAFG